MIQKERNIPLTVSILAAALMLTFMPGCTEQKTEDAQQATARIWLAKARTHLSNRQYTEARTCIDSLRTLCPKAFDARTEALVTHDSICLMEAQDSLLLVDSLVQKEEEAYNALKANCDEHYMAYRLQEKKMNEARSLSDCLTQKVRFYQKKISKD